MSSLQRPHEPIPTESPKATLDLRGFILSSSRLVAKKSECAVRISHIWTKLTQKCPSLSLALPGLSVSLAIRQLSAASGIERDALETSNRPSWAARLGGLPRRDRQRARKTGESIVQCQKSQSTSVDWRGIARTWSKKGRIETGPKSSRTRGSSAIKPSTSNIIWTATGPGDNETDSGRLASYTPPILVLWPSVLLRRGVERVCCA